ncbi:MAG TPA: lysylphosphatidylglycerol synthase transmembrane domain-containing protein [Longimicrobiaceae bacterium]|nr:lysylphosphatidylglycerol synthase transmembrane domain-containing protein [Longimicrobiaceae bacterium]
MPPRGTEELPDGAPRRPRRPRTRLDRLFRTSLILVPFGVLGNLALSWFATDRSVWQGLGGLPRHWLYAAVAIALVPWITNSLRILIWARFLERRMGFGDALSITVGAEISASVLPTSTGSEVLRLGMLMQCGLSSGQAASVVTLGYLEDFVFFVVALPVCVVLSRAWQLPVIRSLAGRVDVNAPQAAAVVVAVAAALAILWRLLLTGRLGRAGRRRSRRFAAKARGRLLHTWRDFRGVYGRVIRHGKLRFALTLSITAIQWACRYSVATAFAYYLGYRVDPLLFFFLQWAIFTIMLFIPTPGASGGAEAAFLLVYSALLPGRVIGLVTAGWRFLTFYLPLALGSLMFAAMNLHAARGRRRDGHFGRRSG